MHPLSRALAPIFTPPCPIKAERARNAGAAKQARKLADEHGIDIKADVAGGWWVTCDRWANHPNQDPLRGNHFVSTGHEMLEVVTTYATALALLELANQQGYEAGLGNRRATNPYGAGPAAAAWEAGREQGAQAWCEGRE